MNAPLINIMIVDDLPVIRKGLALMLKPFNIQSIALAENGESAINLLAKKKPDLIILDLEMPVMNGSQALNKIKETHPTIKVIILSNYHSKELVKDVFNRGANAFLSKQEDIDVIVSAIRIVNNIGTYKDNLIELLKKDSPKDGHWYKLIYTTREKEIIELIVQCKSLKEIAEKLCLSENTVDTHRTNIYKKAEVKNNREFLMFATKAGFQFLGSKND